MSGTTDLPTLLANLAPVVSPQVYVFLSRPHASYGVGMELDPIATFSEQEGLTVVVPKERADEAGESYDGEYGLISLSVHSDLQAVGLTAAVAAALSNHGISANIVAAFYHDHIFVPASRVDDAVTALSQLAADHQSTMTKQSLHIVAGAAGVGKSSFGKQLAAESAAMLLDSDTVTEPVVRAGLMAAGLEPTDRDSPEYKRIFRDAVYECLFQTAADNLAHVSVVIVGPFTRELGDARWPDQLRERFGVEPTIWFLTCDDEVRRQRIERRGNPRDQAKLIDWQQHVAEAPAAQPAFRVKHIETGS